METTTNTLKVVYTYNGKELVLGDVLRDEITMKDLDIISWKAGKFFNAAAREDRPAKTPVNA